MAPLSCNGTHSNQVNHDNGKVVEFLRNRLVNNGDRGFWTEEEWIDQLEQQVERGQELVIHQMEKLRLMMRNIARNEENEFNNDREIEELVRNNPQLRNTADNLQLLLNHVDEMRHEIRNRPQRRLRVYPGAPIYIRGLIYEPNRT